MTKSSTSDDSQRLSKAVHFQASDKHTKPTTRPKKQKITQTPIKKTQVKTSGTLTDIKITSPKSLAAQVIQEIQYNDQNNKLQSSQAYYPMSTLKRKSSMSLAAQAIQEYKYSEKHKKIQSSQDNSAISNLNEKSSMSLAAQAIQQYQYIEQNKKNKSNPYYSALKRQSSISEPPTNFDSLDNQDIEQTSHPQQSQGSHQLSSFPRRSSEMLAAQAIQQYQYLQKHQNIQAFPETDEHTESRRRNSISLAAQAIQQYKYAEQNKKTQESDYPFEINVKSCMSAPQPNIQFRHVEHVEPNQMIHVIPESHTHSSLPGTSPISL